MSDTAPLIDPRSTAEVVAQLVTLLEQYAPAWKDYDPLTREPQGRSRALIHIFARFSEIIIERLNQVPDKNFLAFLDLLGAARQPPQPARVPLTFTLAAGRSIDAVVPKGTQVAAPPAAGEKDPVVFETERPLVVTAAALRSLVTLDPVQDSYGEWSERLITAAPTAPAAVFRGDRALEHVFYFGDEQLLGYDGIKNLRVRFTLAAPLPVNPDTRVVQWERWDGVRWLPLQPTVDPTQNLTVAGTIHFGALPPQPVLMVNQRTGRWLRCRLLTPVTRTTHAVAGMVRASHLPTIKRVIAAVHLERTPEQGVPPDLGFANAAPIDLSKEFLPFGEKPKLHDTFFIASAEAFSKDRTRNLSYSSARIDLDVQVANSSLLPGTSAVRPSPDLELTWECWTGSVWQSVGASTVPPWLTMIEMDAAPLLRTENGTTFAILQGTAPPGAQVSSVASAADGAEEMRYLAVGGDGRFADKRALAGGVNVIEFTATAASRSSKAWATISNGVPTIVIGIDAPALPVSADSIPILITLTGDEAARVTAVRLTSAATGEVISAPYKGDPLNLEVRLREGRNEMLLEALVDTRRRAAKTLMVSRSAKAQPGRDEFADGTFALTQSGIITLRLPATAAKVAVNGQENFWLRARLVKGDYGKEASYVIKDPLKPEDGFLLVPASFRPPIVTSIKIGYELSPRRWPEQCFAYNDLTFTDCSAAAVAATRGFAPFTAYADLDRPALYFGFVPPPKAAFPNTTVSLYLALAATRYGELEVPLAPDASVRAGTAGSSVTHSFVITNDSTQRDTFDIALLGHVWSTTAPASLSIEPGATLAVTVQVSIPASQALGAFDRCVLRLTRASDPEAIASAVINTSVTLLASPSPVALAWQYWNGTRWSKLTVQDDTAGFARSGLVEFLAPADFASRELFGRTHHWLRVVWAQGEYPAQPRVEQVLLNTTLALQTITVTNEVLGSSTGAASQSFRTTRAPVLEGQRLEVREQQSGVSDMGRPHESWVVWEEVPDFYGSSSGDRHYTINHLTGVIRFGDGANGRVPARGSSNVRLAQYRLGGGSRGNCAAGTVVQLKTTVPYVDKVVNTASAAGGAEAESTTHLRERMPRTLRHRDRAVTLEDYEDLALLVSSEVARTRCVPLRDLLADPLGNASQPGAVSIVIVPRSSTVKPLPTLELIERTYDYLTLRAPATVSLAVVGPLYIRVDVRAEIAISMPGEASTVERNIYARLAAFLHPLTGGLDGSGWDFGRAPHRSDFFVLLESVVGVDHVRYLDITEIEDLPGVRATERFLVYSGEHHISLTFEED